MQFNIFILPFFNLYIVISHVFIAIFSFSFRFLFARITVNRLTC